MLLFEQLEKIGYKKAGNWYMHKEISVNLYTKEVKSTNKDVVFYYFFKNKIDIYLLERIRSFIEEIIVNRLTESK